MRADFQPPAILDLIEHLLLNAPGWTVFEQNVDVVLQVCQMCESRIKIDA